MACCIGSNSVQLLSLSKEGLALAKGTHIALAKGILNLQRSHFRSTHFHTASARYYITVLSKLRPSTIDQVDIFEIYV